VLKKYNQYSFLALPLTTNAKENPYRIPVGAVDGRPSFAVLSQLRNIDSARLINKVGAFDEGALSEPEQERAAAEILLSLLSGAYEVEREEH